jgi:hypothetical protein
MVIFMLRMYFKKKMLHNFVKNDNDLKAKIDDKKNVIFWFGFNKNTS